MCLDKKKFFQHNKKSAYKIFRSINKSQFRGLYLDYRYDIEKLYIPNLKKNIQFMNESFIYPAGFHAFPTLKNALSYFLSIKSFFFDKSIDKLVIGKIEFDNIITKGLDNGAKCIVVDSMKILSYEPLSKYIKNVV